MTSPDNAYSAFVFWMKVLLPLFALALLSTVFLFSRGADPEAIPYADIEQIAREPRLAEPSYAGVAEDGSAIAISAEVMRPLAGQADAFSITRPRAVIDAADGSQVEIVAGQARLDGPAQQVALSGLARITATGGYAMETEGVVLELKTGAVTSLGPLEVRTPYGTLTAGHLQIGARSDGAGRDMVFSGGVRLLYQPPKDE